MSLPRQLSSWPSLAFLAHGALKQALRSLGSAAIELLIVCRIGRCRSFIECLSLLLFLFVRVLTQPLSCVAGFINAAFLFKLKLEHSGHVIIAFTQSTTGMLLLLLHLEAFRQIFLAL